MYSNENDENQYGYYNTPAYKISKAINQVGARGASEIQGDFEYMYEENRAGHLSTNKPYITEEYYVLPAQNRKTASYNEQPVMRAQNIRKPIVTDIYDEDHYTLARNSGILTDHPPLDLDDDNHKKNLQ